MHVALKFWWRSRLLCAGASLCLLLAACGGGGGGGGSSSTAADATNANAVSSNPPTPLVSFPASLAQLTDTNVTAIAVEVGPGANVNIPYVTVTVCIPGTSNCSTIDHVLLDTGSTGLRLFASKVGVALPPQTIASSADISECAQFLNTLAWGRVKLADVKMGGESAPSVPVHLLGDPTLPAVPTATCGSAPLLSTSTSIANNTQALNANGILGVGLFANDRQYYFDCATPDSTCLVTATRSEQVQNPVSLFSSINNNGVVVQLPAIPATGAARAQGYLIFGVGTQANNQLGAASLVPVNGVGHFTTVYRGVTMNHSIMDSGSNGLYFNDPAPQVLSGTCVRASSDFYCPAATRDLSASIQLNSGTANVAFSIASADNLFVGGGNYVFNNLGGPLNSTSFDWGLPFFFGRSVYTVIEQRGVPSTSLVGPMHAFTN